MNDLSNGDSRSLKAEEPAHPIAVLIPCHNEAKTIAGVVAGFLKAFSPLCFYDNNSSDATAKKAREDGAVVRTEGRQGKGYVYYGKAAPRLVAAQL